MLTFILLYFNLYLHPRVFLFTRLNPVGMSLSKTLIPDCSTCVHALEKRVWQANVYLLLLYIYLNHIYRILMKRGFQLHLLTITESTPITKRRSSKIKRSRNIRGFVTLTLCLWWTLQLSVMKSKSVSSCSVLDEKDTQEEKWVSYIQQLIRHMNDWLSCKIRFIFVTLSHLDIAKINKMWTKCP